MKIRVANYTSPGNRSGKLKMCVHITSKEATKLFDDGGVTLRYAGDRRFTLVPDEESRSRFGQDTKGYRRVEIFHNTPGFDRFGICDIKNYAVEEDGTINFVIPEKLHAPITRKYKSRKKVVQPQLPLITAQSELTLRQAVEAVNSHVERMGGDLALRIDNQTGRLRALIEY